MMFERSEGVVAVAFRAMEGGAGREGPPFAFRATERVAAGRGTPPLTFRAMEGVAAGRDPSARVSSDGGGGRQRGALRSHFKQRRGWRQAEGPLCSRFERWRGWQAERGPPFAFQATEGVAAGRGTPPLAFRATEGGKVAGSCRLSVTVVCEQKV